MSEALEELLRRFGSVVVLFVVLGSIVDVAQFVWILKRSYRKLKRTVYNRMKREILEEQMPDNEVIKSIERALKVRRDEEATSRTERKGRAEAQREEAEERMGREKDHEEQRRESLWSRVGRPDMNDRE